MPTLSLRKLEQLLTSQGFLPKKVFADRGDCVFLEVMNIGNADTFLLYIPSKYEIQVEGDDGVYKLRSIELGEDGNIPTDYAGEPDDFEMEEKYEEIDADLSPADADHDNLVDHLESNYDHSISLRDIGKDDKDMLRNVFRQLRRLRNCVKGVKYKVAIVFKNYLCVVRRDDTMEGFMLKGYPERPDWVMMVVVDLETLYEKRAVVGLDIRTVRDAIYKVLDKNQLKHTKNLKKLLDKQQNLDAHSLVIYKSKRKFAAQLDSLYTLLERLESTEKRHIQNLMSIETRRTNQGVKGFHTDIDRTNEAARVEKELDALNDVKQEILQNILSIREQQEALVLRVDKIFFETSIMLDAILRNMTELEQLRKTCPQ